MFRLYGRFQSLQLDKPQFLYSSSLHLTDVSVENIGLEIKWSQRWPGTSSLLMSVRPRCVISNRSASEITLIYGKRFCLLPQGDTIVSPEGLSVSLVLLSALFTREMLSCLLQFLNFSYYFYYYFIVISYHYFIKIIKMLLFHCYLCIPYHLLSFLL